MWAVGGGAKTFGPSSPLITVPSVDGRGRSRKGPQLHPRVDTITMEIIQMLLLVTSHGEKRMNPIHARVTCLQYFN